MATVDANGMTLVDLRWKIEGREKTKTGVLRGIYADDVETQRASLRKRVSRGDSLTVQVV